MEDGIKDIREVREYYIPELDQEEVEAEYRRLTYEQIKLVYEIVEEEEDYD